MTEFDWIETYLKPLAGPEGLDLLDDAALFRPLYGQDLVLTQDTLVEGVHFFQGEYGAGTAERLMTANLSDLAAKGARPLGYLLSVSWPKHLEKDILKKWMTGFCKGLETQQASYGFSLFGGDTTQIDGPMTVSATFIGAVPKGKMVKRSGAKLGDDVWVTGTIGDAYLGLLGEKKDPKIISFEPDGQTLWVWEEAFRHPKPQLPFRKVLRKYASASADISDGLLSEANHIAKASRKCLEINLMDIPLSTGSKKWCKAGNFERSIIELATGGDDYQLIFTAAKVSRDVIQQAASKIGVTVTCVGRVKEGEGVRCLNASGQPISIQTKGYSHF